MQVRLQPSAAVLEVFPGESLLDAAHRLGYECLHSCRNGNCLVCRAQLLDGQVRQNGIDLEHGEILTCRAQPQRDCLVHWDAVLAPGELPVRELSCQLIDCCDVGGDVMRLRLRAPAGKAVRYYAGQYLQIPRPDAAAAAFSLASAPHSGRELELHILNRESSVQKLISGIRQQGFVRVRLPFGSVHLAELPQGPLLLIAAGTGMAQMHSLIEHCRFEDFRYPIHLYWGVRKPEDFYRLTNWEQWQSMGNLTVHRIVSDETNGWNGRCALLHEAICQDFTELSGLHTCISGSLAMVQATRDALIAAGMDEWQLHSDVLQDRSHPAGLSAGK